MTYLLGIDLGTSGVKTVLFDCSGAVMASQTVEYPLLQPRNGWAEQKPSDWWNGTVQSIQSVLQISGVRINDIAGVGLSGQMHGLVMLDSDGQVLRNAIIWCDQRTEKQVCQINQIMGEKHVLEITANPAMASFTAAKLLWVREHEPERYQKCAHILLPKDYIRYMLTGVFATDVSDAAGMQLMDIPKRCWSEELLRALEIDQALLPNLYESPDVTGYVTADAAKRTGLAQGTAVVAGAGDNAAAAIGTGIIAEGTAFTTIGTSGVVYAVSDQVKIDPAGRVHTLCASVPGKWTVMSCTQAAGLSLKWLRDTCCADVVHKANQEGLDPYVLMDRLAEHTGPGAEGLLFLPYLMGERSPHLDPACRGVFFGLSAMHDKKHLIRAVLEGVAYAQRDCVDVFREMGVDINQMMVCGGGANSTLWRQILADVYGMSVRTVQSEQGPALGCAILAGVGMGVYPSMEHACTQLIATDKTTEPDPAYTKIYLKYYRLYQKLYRDLKDDYHLLAKLSGVTD